MGLGGRNVFILRSKLLTASINTYYIATFVSETISGHKRGKKTKKVRLLLNIDIILKPNLTNYAFISNRTLQSINVSSFFPNRILPLISWKKPHIYT